MVGVPIPDIRGPRMSHFGTRLLVAGAIVVPWAPSSRNEPSEDSGTIQLRAHQPDAPLRNVESNRDEIRRI
jgi:hypothetical protein